MNPSAAAHPGEATARIDALYNLAQADATLLARLAEAIVPRGPEQVHLEKELANEARELFLEVERLQRVELDRYAADGGPATAAGSQPAADESLDIEAEDEGDNSTGSGTETTSVQVTETTVVTPRLVIDTLLASVTFYVQLAESALVVGDDSTADAHLRHSAADAFSRAVDLRNLVAAQEVCAAPAQLADLDLEMAITQVEILVTWSPTEAGPRLDHLAAVAESQPARSIDVLSLHADYLVEASMARPGAETAGPLSTPLLERALAAYRRAAALLANRLSPPKHIPALQLAPLLSANLASQAHLHLLRALAHLAGSSSSGGDGTGSGAVAGLDEAHRLALEAIAAAKPPVVLVASGRFTTTTTTPTSTTTAAAGPPLPLLPTLSAVRPTGTAQDARIDWAAVAAVRTAYFTLLRVRYYACTPAAAAAASSSLGNGLDRNSVLPRESGIASRVWADWKALGLASGRVGDGEAETGTAGLASLMRSEVEWWLDETDDDAVARAVGAEAAHAEREWWSRLVAS